MKTKTYILPSAAAIALLFTSCEKPVATSTTAAAEETAAVSKASADAKPYPLKVCIVSGEDLGSMGDAISIVHEGQTIKFCCEKCVPKFKENPSKYLTKLEAKPIE